jgi:hypothetical protein
MTMAHAGRAVLLDANLLVLVAVGQFDPALVGRKRLDVYTAADLPLLERLIAGFSRNLTTPHLLAELSNLADQCVPRGRHREFRIFLREFIAQLDERWTRAEELCQSEEFSQLGLADAALCQLADERIALIYVDAELCSVLWARGVQATNFNHVRDE